MWQHSTKNREIGLCSYVSMYDMILIFLDDYIRCKIG